MRDKVFKTLEEQIEILKQKGLQINDERKAKEILFRENYFFISGYRYLLMKEKEKKFIEGASFEELYAIFRFDRMLRNIMFKNILIVENNIKSILSYTLSKKYGHKEKSYLNKENFTQDAMKNRQVNDVLNKMKRQIHVNGAQHTATMHYMDRYGYIPLWILVKVLSFGIVSEFYNILKEQDQEEIAKVYHIDSYSLSIYLSMLANFRNLCAHEDILYDHRTQKVIPNTKYHSVLEIEKKEQEYIYGKNDLFAIIIILKQMLTDSEFRDFIHEVKYEIEVLDGKISTVSLTPILNRIGFPVNWYDISTL